MFTFVELAATRDKSHGAVMLEYARKISAGIKPLALPGDLLIRSREAIRLRRTEMDNSISSKWDGLWTAFNDPGIMEDIDYEEIVNWKRQQEDWFAKMHTNGRTGVQQHFEETGSSDCVAYRRFSSFVRQIMAGDHELLELIIGMSPPDIAISEIEARELGERSEHWRFLLTALAYSIWCRGFKRQNYGRSSSPGSIDVQQAIYIAACDRFVTSDVQQFKMARQIMPFGHKKRHASLLGPQTWRTMEQ